MAKAPKPTFKIPKTLGAVADRIFELREQRSKLNKQADELEEEEKFLKAHVIDNLSKEDAKGVSGRVANVRVYTDVEPTVKDWQKFYAYILKTKDFTFLNKAVNRASVKEVWEDGKKVPGVEQFNAVKVSVTKVNSK